MNPEDDNLYVQAVPPEEPPKEPPKEPEEPPKEPEEPEEPEDGFTLPAKFKGKESRDIAKSYVELEKSIEKKAMKRALELANVQPKEEEKEKTPEWINESLKGVDFSSMKPEDFATFMLDKIESRAQEIAKTTYEAADSTKADVQQAIETASKDWPQLKEKEGFRDMVLTLIENSAGKGEILPLEDACTKVGDLMGIKKGEAPTEPKKPEPKKDIRTGVEKSTGGGEGDNKTEEEKLLSGLMQGNKNPNGLGGLY